MKFIIAFLLPFLINGQQQPAAQTATAGNGVQAPAIEQFAHIEKELPDCNVYRSIGDWVLRATSDKSYYFTTKSVKLHNNQVWAELYNGRKLIYSTKVLPIKNSKIIQSSPTSNSDEKLFMNLYHDDNIAVGYLVKSNNQGVLVVYVRNCYNDRVDNEAIRKLLRRVETKVGIRELIEPLCSRLEFVNANLPYIDYEIQDFPISHDDSVDVDLTKSIGNWTVRTTSSAFGSELDHFNFRMDANKIIGTTYNGPKYLYSCHIQYIRNTRVYKTQCFLDNRYIEYKGVFAFVDRNSAILIGKVSIEQDYSILVISKSEEPFDKEYAKGIIANQLMFLVDYRRVIKDLVPKLVWK